MSPALADDITINLDQETTFVDIPVTVSEPIDATITTTNGLSNSGTWIDSWVGDGVGSNISDGVGVGVVATRLVVKR